MPNIATREEVSAWQKITDEVHRQDGKIVAQLWHSGGYRQLCTTESIVSTTPSGLIAGQEVGEPVTLSEIEELFKAFAQSALNAKNGVLEDLNQVLCKITHDVETGIPYDTHQFKGQIGNIEFYAEIEMATCPFLAFT
jgi:hypothetical protein